MTIRERIWRHLKEAGPQTVREISIALSLPIRSGRNTPCAVAADAVGELQKFCKVKKGKQYPPKYRAIGDNPPIGRGNREASKRALRLYSNGQGNITRALIVQGRHIRPVATTAIEQCWGWLPPASPAIDAQKEVFDNTRGTLRPEETEAA